MSLIADVRAEAEAPGAIVVVVRTPNRAIPIVPEDIVGKSDDELCALLAARLAE